jgi:hypothetical protein
LLVNTELQGRYRRLAKLATGVPDESGYRALLTKSADELRGFNMVLDQLLADSRKAHALGTKYE